ncbi:uncharacterized protein LOC122076905 isoform X3 [Macadamia integrifolia]|uniref:uncharacterized protein LOC122076905 isoform X3 n=1 Tax=Macadamia integrifolia TaxID=60698 RepID=UPI001C4FB650|nr:uncharacterized protein LOC122076905 isoform X3 [Macadamia integrifolia]
MVRSAVLAASFPPPLLCPLRPISVAAATLESPIFPPVEVFEKIAMVRNSTCPFRITGSRRSVLDRYGESYTLQSITSDNPRFCYIEGNFLLQREALNRWDHGIRVAH